MKKVCLGDFSVSRGGSVDPKKYKDEVFDLLSIPAYDQLKPEVLSGSEIGSSKKNVKPGDVLLSRIVPHIRRVWVVGPSRGRRQIASGEWIIYRGKGFDPNFLRHYLLADHFHSQFMKTVSGVGGSLLRARPSEVEKIQIPLPPLPEQRRIAAILDKADSIRCKRQQAMAMIEDFLRSVFLDMFGDPVTNPKGWETGTIRDLVSEVRYGTSQKAGSDGQYPILRMGNVTYAGGWDLSDLKYIDLSEKEQDKYLVNQGDLLFNRTNSKELVGKTAVYDQDKPMAFAGYLIRVRPNEKGLNEYISGYLNSAHGKQTLVGMCKSIVGMANINAQELQDIKILIPPMGEQKKYQCIVKAMGGFRKSLENPQKVSDDLFNSLVQRAFQGEL